MGQEGAGQRDSGTGEIGRLGERNEGRAQEVCPGDQIDHEIVPIWGLRRRIGFEGLGEGPVKERYPGGILFTT